MNLIGQSLDQYEIIEPLGIGGMGQVYKAYQPNLDRYVAIKILPAQHALTPSYKDRFSREARAIAQLSHPNILPIYDIGMVSVDDVEAEAVQRYIVMKYVPGQTLSQLVNEPMPLPEVCRYINQVAAALDHAHERGILHRDIKPDNMLLEEDWLMLADFGLAKIVESGNTLTSLGQFMGTSAYVSPEQASGKPVDRRTDIYSLGIVLYQMLTGHTPYKGMSPIEVIFKHMYEPMPSPRQFNPEISEALEQIIFKATAKEPGHRYDRAGELAEALQVEAARLKALDSQHRIRGLSASGSQIPQTARIFISYKHYEDVDQQLANHLTASLNSMGHTVFSDVAPQNVDGWIQQIEREIGASDFFIILLSHQSVVSEKVQAEVKYAFEYNKLQGQPRLLLVRMAYQGDIPFSIADALTPQSEVIWWNNADNERVCKHIQSIIEERSLHELPVQNGTIDKPPSAPPVKIISPDDKHATLASPIPEYDLSFADELQAPGGVVKIKDKLYIERDVDDYLKREVVKMGTTTTVRAPRQTGKTSLLIRSMLYARDRNVKVVILDLQSFGSDRLDSAEIFLRDLAESIVMELQLDPAYVDKAWRSSLGPQKKLTHLLGNYVLPKFDEPIVLAMDEADFLLQAPFHKDFFGLVRSWHNRRAMHEQWDKLNIVMFISTEPYMLISDVNQSPFNVGLKLHLEDFDQMQVHDLNQRHGSPVQESDLPHLLKLLNGHPYLTRQALYTIVTQRISWSDLVDAAILEQGPFGDHLWRHHMLLRNDKTLRQALKQVIERNHCSDEMALYRLLKAGLIKGSGHLYTCRCDLYKIYFKDKLQ